MRSLVCLLIAACMFGAARADDLRPIYVEIAERRLPTETGTTYRVRIRTPPQVLPGNVASLRLPDSCEVVSSLGTQTNYRCADALHGETVRLAFSAAEVRNPAVLKVFLATGETHTMAYLSLIHI